MVAFSLIRSGVSQEKERPGRLSGQRTSSRDSWRFNHFRIEAGVRINCSKFLSNLSGHTIRVHALIRIVEYRR